MFVIEPVSGGFLFVVAFPKNRILSMNIECYGYRPRVVTYTELKYQTFLLIGLLVFFLVLFPSDESRK